MEKNVLFVLDFEVELVDLSDSQRDQQVHHENDC